MKNIRNIENEILEIDRLHNYDLNYDTIDQIPTKSGKLFLSGINGVPKVEELNIDLVISLHPKTKPIPGVKHYIIDIEDYYGDSEKKKMMDVIAQYVPIIDKYLNEGKNILVHCLGGVSRSVTLVAAYLMLHEKKSAKESVLYLKKIRNCIYPNAGFLEVLLQYEKKV